MTLFMLFLPLWKFLFLLVLHQPLLISPLYPLSYCLPLLQMSTWRPSNSVSSPYTWGQKAQEKLTYLFQWPRQWLIGSVQEAPRLSIQRNWHVIYTIHPSNAEAFSKIARNIEHVWEYFQRRWPTSWLGPLLHCWRILVESSSLG